MAQTTILALGLTETSSSVVVLADGQTRTVSAFVSAGLMPASFVAPVMLATPGAAIKVAELTSEKPAVVLAGPGSFTVMRPTVTKQVGIFLES